MAVSTLSLPDSHSMTSSRVAVGQSTAIGMGPKLMRLIDAVMVST